MKNCVLQKILYYLSVFTSWKQFWGLIGVEKIVWRRCARQYFFFYCLLTVLEIFSCLQRNLSEIGFCTKSLLIFSTPKRDDIYEISKNKNHKNRRKNSYFCGHSFILFFTSNSKNHEIGQIEARKIFLGLTILRLLNYFLW